MKNILATISICGFIIVSILVLLAYKFGQDWAKAMMDTVVPMVIQSWIINFTTVINYHYGSSSGSDRKTDILANQSGIVELTNEVK